jgi:hypothetical protein
VWWEQKETIPKIIGKTSKKYIVSRDQLNHRQAWLAYSYYFIPSMTYCLAAVSMTEKQLLTIQNKATTKFTQLCGYEMTFPKAVVHGPVAIGGLGFQNLYAESNIQKIKTIICNINKQTILGKSMMINLNWVQIHAGTEIPLLETRKT